MNSFQGKICWKRMGKRENKKLSFRFMPKQVGKLSFRFMPKLSFRFVPFLPDA